MIFNVFQASRPNPNANVLLAAPLPIDLRRFGAKHADVALSANLASKDFVRIAVGIMPRARNALEKRFWVKIPERPRTPSFYLAKTKPYRLKNQGRASR